MMKFVTGLLSGVVLTTIGIVTAAAISMKNEEDKFLGVKPDEELLITGNDYFECANKLSDLLRGKRDISSLQITFLGKGDEVLSDVVDKIKSEIASLVYRNVEVDWKTGPSRFKEAAISVVISY